MLLNLVPKLVLIKILEFLPVFKWIIRWAIEKANAIGIESFVQVPVVSSVLGDRLLEERTPYRVARANICKKQLAIISVRQLVVNIGCIGHTQGINVNRVKTCLTNLPVMENVLNSFWVLCKSWQGHHDPAIANAALGDVVWGHSKSTKQGVVLAWSVPVNEVISYCGFKWLSFEREVAPVKSITRWEKWVGKFKPFILFGLLCLSSKPDRLLLLFFVVFCKQDFSLSFLLF